jgi:hypothetical protein
MDPDETEDKIELLPSTENENSRGEEAEGSSITEDQWMAIKSVIQYLLDYRSEEYAQNTPQGFLTY